MKAINRIEYFILTKILRKKLFYTVDIAETGQDYSCFCLFEIDRNGIIKIKKIEHSKS